MRLLVLTVTLMVSVSEARRSARVSSIWDVILGTDAGEKQEALKTNVVKTQQSSVKGYLTQITAKLCNKVISALRKNDQQMSASKTQRSKLPTVGSTEGRRKMFINLMDVYHCPTTGGYQEVE